MTNNAWIYSKQSLKANDIPWLVLGFDSRDAIHSDIDDLYHKIGQAHELAVGSYLYNLDFEELPVSEKALKCKALLYLTSEDYKSTREYELGRVKSWMKSNVWAPRGSHFDSAALGHQEFSCVEIARWLKVNNIKTNCEFLKEPKQ